MTDYDYGSVMHYEFNAFTVNGQPTIIPTRNSSAFIGQRVGMSPIDILEVQRYYQCVPTPTSSSSQIFIDNLFLIVSLIMMFFQFL